MLDVAEQHGIAVDPQKLAEQLGLTVVSMVAARKQGIQALKDAMLASGDSGRRAHPMANRRAMMLRQAMRIHCCVATIDPNNY